MVHPVNIIFSWENYKKRRVGTGIPLENILDNNVSTNCFSIPLFLTLIYIFMDVSVIFMYIVSKFLLLLKSFLVFKSIKG